MNLTGRTKDFILQSVKDHGPLIFILQSTTAIPDYITAVRFSSVLSSQFLCNFSQPMRKKLIWASTVVDKIPLVCDSATCTLDPEDPEVKNLITKNLYIN